MRWWELGWPVEGFKVRRVVTGAKWESDACG